jgi:hypothetical protein
LFFGIWGCGNKCTKEPKEKGKSNQEEGRESKNECGRGFEGGEGFVLYGEKSCGMILWSFSLGGHPSGMDKL